jgi:hypothetical protein
MPATWPSEYTRILARIAPQILKQEEIVDDHATTVIQA